VHHQAILPPLAHHNDYTLLRSRRGVEDVTAGIYARLTPPGADYPGSTGSTKRGTMDGTYGIFLFPRTSPHPWTPLFIFLFSFLPPSPHHSRLASPQYLRSPGASCLVDLDGSVDQAREPQAREEADGAREQEEAQGQDPAHTREEAVGQFDLL
jgi:hypothetical protein